MPQTEAEWLAKAQKGDDEAFSNLVEVYQRPVYNLCYRHLGNAGDAEDAAQETFIRAYKAIKRYDPARKFSTWILTIGSNYCIDQHRRRKLPTFSYDAMPVPDISDKNPGLDKLLVDGEHKSKVMKILDKLNPKDRSAVIMRFWYDYSYDEIANSLSLSNSAVKSRLHRAKRELASIWLEMEVESTNLERTHHEQTI